MLNAEFLNILCCPATRQPLRVADEPFVSALNQRIVAGSVRTLSGRPVNVMCEGALVREDGRAAYPIRGGLPVLLIGEAIDLASS